jgi:hypothetical protein
LGFSNIAIFDEVLPFHVTKKYAVEVKLHPFSNSALAGNQWDGSDILVSLYPQMNL